MNQMKDLDIREVSLPWQKETQNSSEKEKSWVGSECNILSPMLYKVPIHPICPKPCLQLSIWLLTYMRTTIGQADIVGRDTKALVESVLTFVPTQRMKNNKRNFSRRILLNVMYVMVETMRIEDDSDSEELKKARELFRMELSELLTRKSCWAL